VYVYLCIPKTYFFIIIDSGFWIQDYGFQNPESKIFRVMFKVYIGIHTLLFLNYGILELSITIKTL